MPYTDFTTRMSTVPQSARKRALIIRAVLIAILVVISIYFYAGSAVPAGQPQLVRLNRSNVESLKAAFNDSADSVRVIALLSPT